MQPYSLDSVSADNLKHLEQFRCFGIIGMRKDHEKEKEKKFYVTPMIKCLFENVTSLFEGVDGYNYLIVETNFSIFAYVTSNLDRSILESVCEINYEFSGLIVGTITRKAIRNAILKGLKHKNVSILCKND